jgi:hypothetical protein
MRTFAASCIGLGILAALWAPVAAKPLSVGEFSGVWWHFSLPGPEPLSSGPTAVTNLSRDHGVSNYDQLVGDYHNPILKPNAAAVVKKYGDMSLAGTLYASPANQCWPEPGPYIYKNFGLQILRNQPNELTLLYEQDHEVRFVHLNQPHPTHVTPSWYGDSIGHFEGPDTLIVDTVGIKADRPFAMIDLYGTPYTGALHMVERYHLISYEQAKDGLERDAKENKKVGEGTDRKYRGKYLQVTYTIEDAGVFTTPWSATITYGRNSKAEWPETVCAENPSDLAGTEKVPTALRSDF